MDKIDKKVIFLFDLDGTVTKQETLPLIAKDFDLEDKINAITKDTIEGNIPFVEGFIKRVNVLGKLPISKIDTIISNIECFKNIVDFIQQNNEQCRIITGNFRGWVEQLTVKIGCKTYASEADIEKDRIKKLTYILKKEDIVKQYQDKGYKVVVIGDGHNDLEAMRVADISIACGLIHYPATSLMMVADYVVFQEQPLLRLLNQILIPQEGLSVVLSCAGIGSRLGLDKTKALIEIEKKTLIHWQLELFDDIEDLRIVIGYQAKSVIEEVLKIRKDVIFVFNHDYFYTKTGTSYYLGARNANSYVIAWDGDLLVHPNDVKKCLVQKEYIGCSEIVSDEPVFVKINEKNKAIEFSRKQGDYEWVGPACLKRDKIKYTSNNVFNIFEQYLPMDIIKIDARDIDTYEDYTRAQEFVKGWINE